ncbi:hypothetical protein RN001_010525 [Aquatica leii]|uniref:Condensin complex subunit 1 n=1 Tax=Aquatica leii TaxID=1421715 RepID=A0AAN7P6L0_9COLE|nr:hypothetical protein RN001_010525 [Aquatica leii]
MDKVFNHDDTILFINFENEDILPDPISNPYVILNYYVNRDVKYTEKVISNKISAVLHLKNYTNQQFMEFGTLQPIKPYLQNIPPTKTMIFITFVSAANNLSEIFKLLWGNNIINVAVIVYDSNDDFKVYYANPNAPANECASKFNDFIASDCNSTFTYEFPKILRQYPNCSLGFQSTMDLDFYIGKSKLVSIAAYIVTTVTQVLNLKWKQGVITLGYESNNNLTKNFYVKLHSPEMLSEFGVSTISMFQDIMVFIVPVPIKISPWKVLTIEFKPIVWVALLLAFLITALVWWVILKMYSDNEDYNNFIVVFFEVFLITISGSANRPPTPLALRFLFIICSIMSYINFVIPQNKSELLSDNDVQYYVRNVVSIKEIQARLREAKQYYKDDGPEFILQNFDIYYSILHHADQLQINLILEAYEDLQRAVKTLNDNINFILQDKDNLNDEFNAKYVNVIKMLTYIYTNIIVLIEQKIESKRSQTLQKGKQRNKPQMDDLYNMYDKKMILITLSNILQQEINVFWDPPVVEEMFVNLIAEVCYRFLENPTIKADKELCTELFSTLGMLIKGYSHGVTFVIRIVQFIKIHDHLSHCVPDGIQLLVKNYNCKGLIADFVREITEWQTDEKFQDAQGARNCSAVLLEMSNVMPDLMIPEVMYLHHYLNEDSYTLRNSVLHVITEVVLQVLTKPNLTETERESRDTFLSYLMEHIDDTAALVRSKVFQHWSRLQQENAIPLKIQYEILERAVFHLRDKAANVRKAAAICVTTFLSHNIYGSKLQLDVMRAELDNKNKELGELKARLEDSHVSKVKELTEQFQSKEEKLKEVVLKELKEGTCKEMETEVSKEHLHDLVRLYILEDKFKEVFELCNSGETLPEWQKMRDELDKEELASLFVTLIRMIFTDLTFGTGSLMASENVASETELNQLVALENAVEYLSKAVGFMELIDSAIKPMSDLLESVSIGDMQEAIEFFVAAYKFNINNAVYGVLEMIKIMQRNEQERKDHVINAFKRIYLTTDSTTMKEHTTTIVESLIALLKMIPYENYQDLCIIISEWVSKSILDNSIIELLWQYFTKRLEVSEEQSRAALTLLTMATMGRRTIGSKNIKMVATVAFGQRGRDDILLLKAGCEFLEAAAKEKQDITSSKPPFKIKATDTMWAELTDIVIEHFKKKNCYYNGMISSAMACIYRLCSKPEKICEEIIEKVMNIITTDLSQNSKIDGYTLNQISHLLGEVALKQLNFLDESVYKELKRRNYIREERKCKSKNKKINISKIQNASSAKRAANSTNQSSMCDDSVTPAGDESTLEGAQADDTDAEFILNVLENNTVSESSGLGKLAYIIIHLCKHSDQYDNVQIQGTAVNALLRYMLVSSKLCQKHMQLIFTILEKTKYPEVKSNILIHCSDLLERFPNIVEPWTPRIYERLRDDCQEVRRTGFFILANLILRDMIRVQGHISEMACCIVDAEEQLRNMSKNFFTQLSHKGNNLYNVLPDIFLHLCENKSLNEENLKFIMKFLFSLIDKNKQMENLVERFCGKFRITEDDYMYRNIAFCLSLIQYNEKGLRNLLDSFGYYKNILQNDDVYGYFKQILATCNKSVKNEIKALSAELEEKINSGFEINEDGQPPLNPTQNQPKSAFKKPKGRAPNKKARRKKADSDSDEFDEVEKENTPVKQTRRPQRRTPRRKIIDDDDSD